MSQYWQLEYPSQGKLTSASLTKHEARRRLMSWKKTTIARKNSEKQDWIMKQFSWTFKICISWLFCFNNHQLHSIVNIHTISIYQKHFIMAKKYTNYFIINVRGISMKDHIPWRSDGSPSYGNSRLLFDLHCFSITSM